jgi:hypothetical protein
VRTDYQVNDEGRLRIRLQGDMAGRMMDQVCGCGRERGREGERGGGGRGRMHAHACGRGCGRVGVCVLGWAVCVFVFFWLAGGGGRLVTNESDHRID